MTRARHDLCEAFIIDRAFDHSRMAGKKEHGKKHQADWRGPRHFAEERRQAGKVVHIVYATSVAQAIHGLIHQLQGDRRAGKIHVLRFYGHGCPGEQNVGGNRDFSHNATLIRLDEQGHVLHHHFLLSLRKFLDPSASHVELHGCSVGHGGAGHALLVKLANVFLVPVLAAPQVQHSTTVGQATLSQGYLYAAFPGKTHLFKQKVNDYTLDRGASKPPDTNSASGPHAAEYHSAFGYAP
jgi:hypothetical protein